MSLRFTLLPLVTFLFSTPSFAAPGPTEAVKPPAAAAVAAAAPTTAAPAAAPASPPLNELNLNLFRSPSIGLEYRRWNVSVHAGAYPTVISRNADGDNETSWFFRAGLTHYFLGHSFYGQRPSEFFFDASYVRGLNLGHENGALLEVGYRWMVWSGLNLRLGAAVLLEPGEDAHFNPTPGIGWSQAF